MPTVQALDFWKRVVVDRSDMLERSLALLRASGVPFCVVGGQAVNAYADPLVSLDLDIAIATDDADRLAGLFAGDFKVERFPHSLNVSDRGSKLRLQFRTDPCYRSFVERATERDVLGLTLPAASPEDVLQGKVWAAQDPTRRAGKRAKDVLDISRLLEVFPNLRAHVPEDVLARLP
jgi:hypothetical protein